MGRPFQFCSMYTYNPLHTRMNTTLYYIGIKRPEYGVHCLGSNPTLFNHLERKREPTPVFLPGEFHGQRSLAGHSSWSHRVRHDWVTNTYSRYFGEQETKMQWDTLIDRWATLFLHLKFWELVSFLLLTSLPPHRLYLISFQSLFFLLKSKFNQYL